MNLAASWMLFQRFLRLNLQILYEQLGGLQQRPGEDGLENRVLEFEENVKLHLNLPDKLDKLGPIE